MSASPVTRLAGGLCRPCRGYWMRRTMARVGAWFQTLRRSRPGKTREGSCGLRRTRCPAWVIAEPVGCDIVESTWALPGLNPPRVESLFVQLAVAAIS